MKRLWLVIPILISVFTLAGCQVWPRSTDNQKKDINVTDEQICGSQGCSPSEDQTGTQAAVPLSTGEDIIRSFFNLINEKRIPDAVSMLSSQLNPDESLKQAWGVNFTSMQTVEVKSIQPWNEASWTEEKQVYQVILGIYLVNNQSGYGWDNGENTRWLELVKNPQTGF